jgi:hypothetical protein
MIGIPSLAFAKAEARNDLSSLAGQWTGDGTKRSEAE